MTTEMTAEMIEAQKKAISESMGYAHVLELSDPSIEASGICEDEISGCLSIFVKGTEVNITEKELKSALNKIKNL